MAPGDDISRLLSNPPPTNLNSHFRQSFKLCSAHHLSQHFSKSLYKFVCDGLHGFLPGFVTFSPVRRRGPNSPAAP